MQTAKRRVKNQRLVDAIAQHKNAKPRSRQWLVGIVGDLYKLAEARLKKAAGDAALYVSIVDVVFDYGQRKYGQKLLVDEFVGSMMSTLTRYMEVRAYAYMSIYGCIHDARDVGEVTPSKGAINPAVWQADSLSRA